MSTAMISLNRITIMEQQKISPRKTYNDDEVYKDPEFRKIFPPKTNEQIERELIETLEHGHFMDYRKSLRRIREEFGL